MKLRTCARSAGAVAAVVLTLVAGTTPAQASVPSAPDSTAKTDGAVRAIAQVGDLTYIGGSFTRVGGRPRTNLAAIRADGTVDPAFAPQVDGMVYALSASADGTTLYVGGTFANAGGAPHANLAALDLGTGLAVDGWSADTTGDSPHVLTLATAGDRLYVGGKFLGIDGTTRKRLAALDPAGNVTSSFKPSPNGPVKEVVVSPDATRVYAGGGFSGIGGVPRASGAAELFADTGLATSFAPEGDGGGVVTVELTPDGSTFFYSSGNNTIFAYDLVGGHELWRRKMSGDTQAMAASVTGELYVGGHFSQNLDTKTKRDYFASFTIADGTLTGWDPLATGSKMGVWALEIDGNHLHAGGVFKYFNGVAQRGYARFTGTP